MSRLTRTLASPLTLLALTAALACGGSDSGSPVGPGPAGPNAGGPLPSPGPSASGATVSGSITGSAGSSAVRALGSGLAGVTVSVEGTSLSVVTGSGGQFTLPNVPPGLVRLAFQGAGASGSVQLDDVTEGERISLDLVVTGSAVELESQERVTGSQAQLEGKIVSVDETSRTLVIGTTTVVVPEGTPITHGFRELEFTDLLVGARIHVKGTLSGDTITATRIIAQQTGLESVKMSGIVSDAGGMCPEATFQFGSTIIAVNASTKFVKGTCADLQDGAAVEIKGLRRADGSVLATMVKFTDGGDDEGPETVEFTGTISALEGPCPARKFQADGREVHTTGATTFVTPCASLANGQSVEVAGKVTGNGKVTASRVNAG